MKNRNRERNLLPIVTSASIFKLWDALRWFIVSLVLLSSAIGMMWAQTTLPGFTISLFGGSNISSGSAMEFAPDGRLFVCQQTGQVRIIKNGVLLSTPFTTIDVDADGERGLLGIAFDPQFSSNHYVYFFHTSPRTTFPRHSYIVRYTANGDVGSARTVIRDLGIQDATNHNGGAIHFGPDGKLYIGCGDDGNGSNSQRFDNWHGKMLRINRDGSIPTDNPFYNQTTGTNRAIWALGLRNPFTFAFQPRTGRMFINDVGWFLYEEINEGIRGANYGWPNTEGFFDPASFPNFTNPKHAYYHDAEPGGCAITGGTFYNPVVPCFPNAYVGKYFFADLCNNWIRFLDPGNPIDSFEFVSGLANPVDIKVGPDGAMYVLQRGNGSGVYRVGYSAQVSGMITLEGCREMVAPIIFTFRPASGSPFTRVTTLASNGSYTLTNIPANIYQVAIKGSRWLQKVMTVNTMNGDISDVNTMLRGGDANNDNSVDIWDLDVLIQAFDTIPSHGNWNENADFNCDNSVDVLDLDILIQHFDMQGDS